MKNILFLFSLSILFLHGNSQFSFNFFNGSNAALYKTSPKVLGSGIFDFSGKYNFLRLKVLTIANKIDVLIVPGFKIAKYRFDQPIRLDLINGQVTATKDTDPTHFYSSNFFSYDGSKLVTMWWHVPVFVLFNNGDADKKTGLFVSAFADFYALSYQRLHYQVNNETRIEKIKYDVMRKYPFNKTKFGFEAGFLFESGYALSVMYMYTSMFKTSAGPTLNEMRIGLDFPIYDYSSFK